MTGCSGVMKSKCIRHMTICIDMSSVFASIWVGFGVNAGTCSVNAWMVFFSFFSPNHVTHWRSKQFALFRLKRTGGFANQGRNCFPMFRQWGCNINWEYTTILRDAASSQISQRHAGFCSTFHIFKVLLTRNDKSTFEDGFENTQQKKDLMFIHFFAA